MKRIIMLFLAAAITSLSFAQIKVFQLTDTLAVVKKNSLIYSLPMTVIKVKVVVETEYFFPGPYHKFADKYLTIKGVKSEASQFNEIKDVCITARIFADPSASFIITSKKELPAISFSSIGGLTGYGVTVKEADCNVDDYYLNIPQYYNQYVHFTDLSMKRNFSDITDTTYKVVQIDSIFQKIPIYNKTITSKEFEQKAEEAANFIIKIRKRRFKLMTGEFETDTPPKNVEMMIHELDSLESQYLELFTGKTEKIINEYYFEITPDPTLKEQKIKLFDLDEGDTNPESVYVEIEKNDLYSSTELFYQRQLKIKSKDKKKGLFYRMPGYGNVKVTATNHIYAQETMLIPQFGLLNYLPAKMFKNKKLQIIFDENSGSIKTISNE